MIITEPKALKQALTSIKRVTLKRDNRRFNHEKDNSQRS